MSDAQQSRWDRADRILEQALDLPATERQPFVRRLTADDADLEALVSRLLRAASAPDPRLDRPASDALHGGATTSEMPGTADFPHADEFVGRRLGPYEIVRELGRGGMAVVYLGLRRDGEFEQEVAIKILRRGFETREVLHRFRRERQILAGSSHENLARIYDSGETEDGRPYFVMERVDGQRIDRWCDENRRTVRERVELVVAVAHAVEDAHRRLVVHRDIKPSNILVTAAGRPKLLDFGIAKVLAAPGGDVTLTTARLMTPAYAAPEQVRGGEVTTATDVYQLGLLLYELLTGALPYSTDDGDRMAVERRICEDPPLRPAAALRGGLLDEGELADRRATSVRELRRELRGDLEAILLRALRKEPYERYVSVTDLALDLERYLARRPVRARPPTVGYQLRRFVGRHRVPVAAAALVLVLLVAFAASMTWQARRLAVERDRANRENESAQAVASFLSDLFRSGDPTRSRAADVTARDLLDLGAERLADAEELPDPLVRARLQAVIGGVYRNLAAYPQAEPLLRDAVAGLTQWRGPEDAETLRARRQLIVIVHLSGRMAEARRMAEEQLEIERRLLGEDADETMATRRRLGEIAHTEGRLAEAESLFRASLAADARLHPDEPAELAYAQDRLARVLLDRGQLDEAERLTRQAIAGYTERIGADHPSVAVAEAQLAGIRQRQGNLDQAAVQLEAAVAKLTRIIGTDHQTTLSWRSRLAQLEQERGNRERAWALHEEVMAGFGRAAPEHPACGIARGYAAVTLASLGRFAEARALADDAVALLRRTVGDASPYTLAAEVRRASMLSASGAHDEAATAFADLVVRAPAALGRDHVTSHAAWVGAARAAARTDHDDAALALLREAAAAGSTIDLDDPALERLHDRGALREIVAAIERNRRAKSMP